VSWQAFWHERQDPQRMRMNSLGMRVVVCWNAKRRRVSTSYHSVHTAAPFLFLRM